MVKIRKTIIYLFFLFLFVSFVAAPVPVSIIFTGDTGLQLESAPLPIFKLGEDYELEVHVFDFNNGLIINNLTHPNNITCSYHIYNKNGSELFFQPCTRPTYNFIAGFDSSYYPTPGLYSYSIHCNTTSKGGFLTSYFRVTETGENKSQSLIPIIAIILLPMILGLLFLIGSFTMNEEHNVFKLFLFLLVPVFFFISMHFGAITIIQFYDFPVMEDLIGRTSYYVGIMFFVILCYFLIYGFYKMIRTAAQEKKESLKY